MAEFGRYNKNLNDIATLTNTAVMASNVTTLSSADAAKALNTAMITFGKDAKDSMSILDSWNELQNNFRVSAEDLASSIGKVGAIANQTGTDLNSLNAMTTTLVSSMGINGDEAGTALKSIMSRIYNVGAEGDGGKAQQLLKQYGIQVQQLDGSLLPLGQTIQLLSDKFKSLTQAQKLQIEQTIGGTYHFAKVAQLIELNDKTMQAYNSSLNSENSALNENAKYLATTTAKYEQFKVSLQSLANSSFNTDFLKGFVSTGTEGIKILDKLIKTVGLLPITVGLATVAFSLFNKNIKNQNIISYITGLESLQKAFSVTAFRQGLQRLV
jgi:TP901 family phage tail tape measure protein